jgi:hypothetical protein
MQFATRANSSIDFVQRLNSAETVVRAWIPDAEGGTKVVVPAAEAAASKANTSKPATYVPPPMRGGYTYGKRIKGSRRRRGKKSRKKGKAKK